LREIPCLEAMTPLDVLRRDPERARDLARGAANTFGLFSRGLAFVAAPWTDRASRAWLQRSANPYLAEIDAMAKLLGISGVYSLNVCFEWGCTTGVWPSPQGPTMRRVLDWKFPGLGENIVVVRQQGDAGAFLNPTWPGLSGSFQALAPGRFAVAINQAPMRRHRRGAVGDWFTNRLEVHRQSALPPAHLLRQACEGAPNYAAAKAMLCHTPIAVPGIFILAGVNQGEGCVIERSETAFALRQMEDGRICAANHFESMAGAWRARPIDSAGRAACALGLADETSPFAWFRPPIANDNSRLVLEATPATGALALMGTNGSEPVTSIFRVNPQNPGLG